MAIYCNKGLIIESVLYTYARNNLREIINKVDASEYLITTKDKKSVVMISKDEYDALKETLYLLTSNKNRKRLLDAVNEIENSKFLKKILIYDNWLLHKSMGRLSILATTR